jgi:glycosyltransferase involved in cell wall biosynthesis
MGAKRRVLMVAACPFPASRGTPARILRMAEELGQRGHDVHVATYHLGQTLENLPFTVHRIRDVRTYRKMEPGPAYQKLAVVDPLLAIKVAAVAREIRPDVIHAHHYEGLLVSLPLRLRNRCPTVFDAHVLLDGELEYYSMGLSAHLRQRIARTLDRWAPRWCDHVIAISQEIRDRLCMEHKVSPSRISVVANGVEDMFFRGRPHFFPDDGQQRLIFTGNLASYQGTGLMLEAFALVANERRNVRLVIVTDSDRREFEAHAQALGVAKRIDFLNATLDELPHLIASADVALNPRTRCPGVPLKLLNYMAAGAAVVSFAGSAKYLVHGRNGLVVDDGDVPEFARGILKLLAAPEQRDQLGMRARTYAANSLSWAQNAVAVERVYDLVLATRYARTHEHSASGAPINTPPAP